MGVWVAPVFEFDVLLIASVLSSVFIFRLLLRETVECSSRRGIQKLTGLVPGFHCWEHRKAPLVH